ncbi:camphor resistance protein CrcB [Paramesorhizobium deserti]|uniref:Fluoride-specific ion channel FluC n=1 Tax=Paramesorhizobium deserti TaxID=1494590 RepID=A0A135HZE6_9HYPH|nr:fluoride efflux transporter CrcB [Paramesorhizobium deserti]KXF78528.1 camphor resistance protein CrcB [Paramesorhizobium deserti]
MKQASRKTEALRLYLAVGCGAALGALLRFVSGFFIVSGMGAGALWATGFVNVVGSFVIMLFATITGPDGRWMVGPTARQFVMGGICGGFTTFSAMSLDAFLLALHGGPVQAVLYLTAVIFFSLAAAWVGYACAMRINR